jgi:hypothetical protein
MTESSRRQTSLGQGPGAPPVLTRPAEIRCLDRAESTHLADDRFRDLGAVRPDDPYGDQGIMGAGDPGRALCHGCDSRVDRLAMTAGDCRIVRSVQPAAADGRPPTQTPRFPKGRGGEGRRRPVGSVPASALRRRSGSPVSRALPGERTSLQLRIELNLDDDS